MRAPPGTYRAATGRIGGSPAFKPSEVHPSDEHWGIGDGTRHQVMIVAELVEPVLVGEARLDETFFVVEQLANVEHDLGPREDLGLGLDTEAVLALGRDDIEETIELGGSEAEGNWEAPGRLKAEMA